MADIVVDEGAEEVANIASTEQPSKVSYKQAVYSATLFQIKRTGNPARLRLRLLRSTGTRWTGASSVHRKLIA